MNGLGWVIHATVDQTDLREIQYAEVVANRHDSDHGMDNGDGCCNDGGGRLSSCWAYSNTCYGREGFGSWTGPVSLGANGMSR